MKSRQRRNKNTLGPNQALLDEVKCIFKRNNLLNGGVDRARLDTRSSEINYDVVPLRGIIAPACGGIVQGSASTATGSHIDVPLSAGLLPVRFPI